MEGVNIQLKNIIMTSTKGGVKPVRLNDNHTIASVTSHIIPNNKKGNFPIANIRKKNNTKQPPRKLSLQKYKVSI